MTVTTGGRGFIFSGCILNAAHIGFDVRFGDAFDAVTEFGCDQLGRIGIDGLRDRRHDAELHQRLDNVGGALGHAVGEFLDGDSFGDRHIARDLDLLLLLLHLAFFTLDAAAHGRHTAAPSAAFVVG